MGDPEEGMASHPSLLTGDSQKDGETGTWWSTDLAEATQYAGMYLLAENIIEKQDWLQAGDNFP